MPATMRAPMMLIETFSIDPTKLNESDGTWKKKLPDGRWKVRCVGQWCWMGEGVGLRRNRNNRRYPASKTWGPHLQEGSPFQRRIGVRRVIGQVEHPTDGRNSLGAAAIVITKAEKPTNEGQVFIEWETLATPGGQVIAGLLESNVGFGMSSRATGVCERADDGVDEVQGDFEPVTWDCVADESTPGAEVAAVAIRESLERMVTEAGSLDEAVRRDRVLAESALRNLATCVALGGAPATCCTKAAQEGATVGRSRWQDHGAVLCSAGGRHYRAYEDGLGRLDVWAEDKLVAESVADITAARQAALAHVKGGGSLTEDAMPPGGEWCLGAADGLGHYRCFELGPADWAVWYVPHVGEPNKVACGLRTRRDATAAAEEHSHMTTEAVQPTDVLTFEGTCVRLRFDSPEEGKKGCSALEKAGFACEMMDDTSMEVTTAYSDPEAALSHLSRVLRNVDIEVEDMQESRHPRGGRGGRMVEAGPTYGRRHYVFQVGDRVRDVGGERGRVKAVGTYHQLQRWDQLMDPDAYGGRDAPVVLVDYGGDTVLWANDGDTVLPESSRGVAPIKEMEYDPWEDDGDDYMGDDGDLYDTDDEDDMYGDTYDEAEASMGVSAPSSADDRQGPEFVGDPEAGADPTMDQEDAEDPYTGEYMGTDPEDLDLDLSVHERKEMRRMARKKAMKRKKAMEAYEVGDTGGVAPDWLSTSGQGGADVKPAQTPKGHAGGKPGDTDVVTGGTADIKGGQGEERDDQRKAMEAGSNLPDKGAGGRGGMSEPQSPAKMAEKVIKRALPDLRAAWARGDGRRAAKISRFIERTCRRIMRSLDESHPSRRVRYLQNEVARLEDENAHLRSLTEAMAEVQRDEVLAHERKLLLQQHPALAEVDASLQRCYTVEELREEAAAFLKVMGKPAALVSEASEEAQDFISKEIRHLVNDKGYTHDRAVAAALNIAREKGYDVKKNESTSPSPAPVKFVLHENKGAAPAPSVSSGHVDGAPSTKPAAESMVVSGSVLVEGTNQGGDNDSISRLVKYRRRRRGGR